MKQLQCHVSVCEQLTPMVYRLVLDLPEALSIRAGSYLQVVMSEQDKRPFSIASAAGRQHQFELHIGATADNPYAYEVIQQVQQHQCLTIEAPLGAAWWRGDSVRPLILVAGGTGFSYTWSILQSHLAAAKTQPITLYWGVRSEADLYAHQQLIQLAEQHSNFSYRPVVEHASDSWHGAQGLVHLAVLAEQTDLAEADVYVAGRFAMVRVVRDSFHAQGLPLAQLYGDALAYL